MKTAGERLVDVTAEICRQDDGTVVLFELLEEIGDFDVGVAVVRVFHFAPLAEEGVGFVEEEYALGAARGGEDAIEILFRLADILADDAGQIDAKHVEPQMIADDGGSHGLARAGSAREQGFQILRCPSVSDRSPRRRRRCGDGGSLRRVRGLAAGSRREARDRPTSGSLRRGERTDRSCSRTGCGCATARSGRSGARASVVSASMSCARKKPPMQCRSGRGSSGRASFSCRCVREHGHSRAECAAW